MWETRNGTLNWFHTILRRTKNKETHLIKTKYLWLTNPENLSDAAKNKIESLSELNLKVSEAWSLKECFKPFWECSYKASAKKYFDAWYEKVIESKLPEMIKVADMLKKHLDNILTYFDHSISNAKAEGLNSKIQMVKSNARGYRSFQGFRNSILFHCGKLEMEP